MSTPPPPPSPYGSPYGSPYYGAREHPQGMTILVLGILGLVVCGLLGPVAWVMGNNALAEIDRNPAAYTNRGTVQAGRICGIVATCLLILGVVIAIIAIAAAAASSST
jgi:Domain of unknown function (DUF4190)